MDLLWHSLLMSDEPRMQKYSTWMGKLIPRNLSYPTDAIQCDDCGGNGLALNEQFTKEIDCPTCKGMGWLPKDHPRGRTCERKGCKNPIPPHQIALYCSNECAFEDA